MIKLMASSYSLDEITKMIGKYYYSKNISLKQVNENIWEIYNLDGQIKDYHVVLKKKRYRFEIILNNVSNKNGILKSKDKSSWEALIAPHKPIETENDEYVIDDNSSGIYTPVLEGVAKINPSRFKLNHYITSAKNYEKQGDLALNKNNHETALRSYSMAFITSLIGSHVDFMAKAKVKPSKTIDNLYKLHDCTIVYNMVRQSNKRFQLKKVLLEKGNVTLVEKIEKEFNLYFPKIKKGN